MRKLNILGTEYSFEHNTKKMKEINADGQVHQYSREIIVRDIKDMLEEEDRYALKKSRYCEVCRHEVIHALLCEAGFDKYSDDESLVTFLAVQFPKMARLFKKNGWLKC